MLGRATALLLLATGLLAAGCSGEAPASPLPLPRATSPSPTGSAYRTGPPSPGALVVPTVSPSTNVQAITQLISRYYLECNRAMSTGDTKTLRSLSTSECPCLTFPEYVERRWRSGKIVAPDYYRSLTIEVTDDGSGDGLGVATVRYSVGSEVNYDKSGRVVNRVAPMVGQKDAVEVARIAGHWRIRDVRRYAN